MYTLLCNNYSLLVCADLEFILATCCRLTLTIMITAAMMLPTILIADTRDTVTNTVATMESSELSPFDRDAPGSSPFEESSESVQKKKATNKYMILVVLGIDY